MREFLLLLLLVPVCSFSQVKVDSINNRVFLEEVKEVEGSAKDLKERAFEWIAKSYNNSNFVTRMNTDNKIITKGTFESSKKSYLSVLTNEAGATIPYDLELSFKDGRYKIELKNLESIDLKFSTMSKSQFKQWMVDYYSTQTGGGVKYATKKINDDKYITKTYGKMKEQTIPILEEVKNKIIDLNLSLFSYMKSKAKNDDW